MSDTPRTDAAEKHAYQFKDEYTPVCESKLVRQLERELNAAQQRIKRLEEAGDMMALHAQLGGIPLDHIGWVNAWREAKEAKL